MNKKTLRIAGWALGLSMAVAGMGVALGASQKAPVETNAATNTVTFAVTGWAGNTTKDSYVTTLTAGTGSISGGGTVAASMNNYIPKNGQVKGNQTSVSSNWYLYNTAAIPGAITAISLTGTGTLQNNLYASVGTATQASATSGTRGDTDPRFSWTFSEASNYTYFKLLSNEKFTSGNVTGVVVTVTYVIPSTPVSTISTDVTGNAMNIGSSDGAAHTVNVSINSTATDKKINIAYQDGTEDLFTPSASQITADASGNASFTITGTGAKSGSETFRISSNSTPAQYVDLVVTALDDSIVWRTISTSVEGYSISGSTSVVDGGNASITLVAGAKHNLPSDITVTGTYTSKTYNNLTGAVSIVGVKSNIAITFDDNPASVTSIALSGAKTSFTEYEAFSTDGLVVTATYDDEAATVEAVPLGSCTVDSSAYVPDVLGTYTISVTFGGQTETYDVTVKKDVIVAFASNATDTLTATLIGQASYGNWSGKKDSSGTNTAVYAGNSQKNASDAIQARNSGNSGFVTTTSGGYFAGVTVEWAEGTSDKRYIDVYGKNTAYSASSDLYDDAKVGTLIGTITKESGNVTTSVFASTAYQYVGLKIRGGAVYLDSIKITWGSKATDSDINAVDAFISSEEHGMHLDHTTNDGSCKTWYGGMKSAYNALTDARKAILLRSNSKYRTISEAAWSYKDVLNRILAWAEANGDKLGDGDTLVSKASAIGHLDLNSGLDSNLPFIITIVAIGTIAAAGGFFFIQHKRRSED